jgi:hypothetical protein
MTKKTLIIFLFFYIFISEFLTGVLSFSYIKVFFAVFSSLLFVLYLLKNIGQFDFLLLIPIVLIPVYILVWQEVGYINLFYTFFFGWAFVQDIKLTLKLLKYVLIIQLILVLFEVITGRYIFDFVNSGVIGSNVFDTSNNVVNFEETGFRPKGLFTGTLVATSFVIYMSMIFRNNRFWLITIFILAILTNGRLAVFISLITLFLHLALTMDIVFYGKRVSFILKLLFTAFVTFVLLSFLISFLSEVVLNNFKDAFSITSKANAGRVFAYAQAFLLFMDYSFIEKLFGTTNNVIFDIWGREIASESGLVSMLLDIGLVGFSMYLFFTANIWKINKGRILDVKNGLIEIKYVVLVTWLSIIQYEHVNGNLRGALFWFIIFASIKMKGKSHYESSNN